MSIGPERRGPERPGPDYPAEWDREPAEPSTVRTVIDPIEIPAWCDECEGTGGWTETVEGPSGRDEDINFICKNCQGSGRL